jgi:O-methyltransferase
VSPTLASSPSLRRRAFLAARDALSRARGKRDLEEPLPAPVPDTLAISQSEARRQDETPVALEHTPSPAPKNEFEVAPPQSDFAAYARFASPMRANPYSDFDDTEREIYLASHINVVAGAEAIVSLVRAVRHIVKNNIAGAFVECGVYRGGNIEVMIRTLQTLGVDDRDIFLYDTFAGMPRPDVVDDAGLDNEMKQTWEAHRNEADGNAGSNWMRAGIDLVRERLAPLGYPLNRLHFVKGLVEDTIPSVVPQAIALLRLDTDFYSSTKHELVHLYPLLAHGGVLIIDDYGAMPGCRRAVDEYNEEHGLHWYLSRLDAHVRLVIKP